MNFFKEDQQVTFEDRITKRFPGLKGRTGIVVRRVFPPDPYESDYYEVFVPDYPPCFADPARFDVIYWGLCEESLKLVID